MFIAGQFTWCLACYNETPANVSTVHFQGYIYLALQTCIIQSIFKKKILCVCLPGVESCATSGTTISVPVKSHLSPAWACSTASALRIISTLKITMLATF